MDNTSHTTNQNDGFSTMAPLLFTVGGNGGSINISTLVGHDRIADSTDVATTTTLLLDVTDVANPLPVPHWTEVDSFEPGDRPASAVSVLVMQPAAPLHFNRTYVAAARGIYGWVATEQKKRDENRKQAGGAGDDGPSGALPVQPFFEQLATKGALVECGAVPAERCQFMMQRYKAVVAPALLNVGWHSGGGDGGEGSGAAGSMAVQVAWDFSTISRENSLARFETMRDDALSVVGTGEDIVYSIDLVEEHSTNKCTDPAADGESGKPLTIGRTVWGHFLAPNYMDTIGNGVHLSLTKDKAGPDSSGKAMPVQNGEVRVPFIIRIPCSLLAATSNSSSSSSSSGVDASRPHPPAASPPFGDTDEEFGPAPSSSASSSSASSGPASTTAAMLVQYGHGLMGDRSEVKSSYLGEQAQANQWILVASEWEGMSQFDLVQAARVFATRLEEFNTVPETTLQGWVNKQVAMKLYRSAKLVSNEHLQSYSGIAMLKQGTDQPISYYGNSQGSVIGGGYFASSLELERATLGVPGSPFALLLTRSLDFESYNVLLKLQLANEADLRLTLSLVQQIWDVAESGGWLQTIGSDNAPGVSKKQVLMQAGLGDAQVTPLGAEVMARGWVEGGLNVSLLDAPLRPVFGLETRGSALPEGASGLTEYSFYKVGPAPFGDTPANGTTDTHECVRRNAAAQQQMKLFMERGVIQQFCRDGDCSNQRGCHDECQRCDADGLWFCCSDVTCNQTRSCASNAALKTCACP